MSEPEMVHLLALARMQVKGEDLVRSCEYLLAELDRQRPAPRLEHDARVRRRMLEMDLRSFRETLAAVDVALKVPS